MRHTHLNVNKICADRFAWGANVIETSVITKGRGSMDNVLSQHKKITIGEAVRLVRMKQNLTINQLADQVPGYDGGNLSRFERNKQNITEDKLKIIAKELNTSIAALYLVAETGDLESINKNNHLIKSYAIENTTAAIYTPRKVPVISMVHAGCWAEVCENMDLDSLDWKDTSARVSAQSFALKVVGDSMVNPYGQPSIPEGAFVIVDPSVEVTNGCIVVAKLEDSNEATLKKFVQDGPNKYLVPLNPNYKPFQVNGNCRIVGVVKQMEIVF